MAVHSGVVFCTFFHLLFVSLNTYEIGQMCGNEGQYTLAWFEEFYPLLESLQDYASTQTVAHNIMSPQRLNFG